MEDSPVEMAPADMAPAEMAPEPAPADMAAGSKKASSKKSSKKSDSKKEKNNDDENTPMMGAAGAALAGTTEALGLGAFSPQDDGSDNTLYREPVRSDCCCCLCGCSNELTVDKTCLFCFPIKAGVVIIGLIIFLIAFVQFNSAFFQFANITLPWWKPTVTLVLFTPGFVGACFFIGWYTKDCTRTRSTLTAAVIQSLTSYVLILIWEVIYIFAIEKKDTIGSGYGDNIQNYTFESKKKHIYVELAWGIVAVTFYILALVSVRKYVNCYPSESEFGKKK